MSSATPATLATVRAREFPVCDAYTYLNTAANGPLPERSVRAVEETLRATQFPGTDRYQMLPPPEAEARAKLARLINAAPEDFVFTGNTTHGINIAAHGIDWRAGDNVVVPAGDFPSLSYAWHNLSRWGVEVRWVPWTGAGPGIGDILARVDSHTRAVSCSAIKWDTGYAIDLYALGAACASKNVLLIVDGIQLVGAQPLDVKAARISALATHGYKWLLAGHGLGALYVAPEALDRIRPGFIGYTAVAGDGLSFSPDFAFKAGAARYGTGGGNRLGQAALLASLALLEEIGVNTITEQNAALTDALRAGLKRKGLRLVSPEEPAQRTAITVFTLGERARDEALVTALEKQRIIVSLRPLGVRVSPNFYNTESDVARLLDALPA